ncbi:MAG: DMT family transporter [Patescibacteria group bacterium]
MITTSVLGIVFSVTALLCWAVGDFSIQRGTRQFGNWGTIFIIGILGAIFIFPFVRNDLPALFSNSYQLGFMVLLSVITLFAALFLFEGLKRGKLAIIEPVFGIELPFTVAFSIIFGGEHLGAQVYFLIGIVFIGLMLAIVQETKHLHFHKTLLEKGVLYAGVGSIAMGLMNFMTGVGSQNVSPLVTIWFVHTFLAICCAVYFFVKKEWTTVIKGICNQPAFVLTLGFFDNAAWIAYASAMSIIPISIATTISESYIVLTVLLGVWVNKEKIRLHQYVGIGVVIFGVLALSILGL